MVKIIFVESDGSSHSVQATLGRSVMEAARDAGIRGIVAECGGACACSTCHVYVADAQTRGLAEVSTHEQDMLEFAWEPRAGQSRLSCQLKVTPDMDGLILTIPARQG